MFLKDGESNEGKPVRVCRERIPSGTQASLMAWELLSPESEDARIYTMKMQARLASRRVDGNGGSDTGSQTTLKY